MVKIKNIYIVALIIWFSASISNILAQDSTFARKMMMILGSPQYMGRGYVGDGNIKAAKFISKQFEKDKLLHFGNDYFQKFSFPINTIQQLQNIVVDSDTLIAGSDFYIANASKSTKGKYKLIYVDDSLFVNDAKYLESLLSLNLQKSVLVFHNMNAQARFYFKVDIGGIIFLHKNKLNPWGFSHAQEPVNYAIIDIIEDKFPLNAHEISLDFKAKFFPQFPTQNVISYVEGTKYPDSFIVVSAHYDHMGMMGQNIVFPGGNDNLSGTSMVLNMARYYSMPENKPDYSIVFMLFSGEEVGLLGSSYYVKNPLFDLDRIHFLINLDMVGTGSKGIVVVNGTIFKKQFHKLVEINNENNYLARVKIRGESCNSDHCPFYMNNVPSFFIYTFGDEYSEYHSPTDLPEKVPLTKYIGVFSLIRDFINEQ